MQSSNTIPKYVPWGEEPDEGMILMGFSCEAVLEGKELKSKIVEKIREGELGFRKAVELFQEEGGAGFDQALDVVKRIRRDIKSKSRKDKSSFMSTPYQYSINRVFWAHEKDMPKNDPRYFKLNIIDCQNIDVEKYKNADKSFNSQQFIKDYMPQEERKKAFQVAEIAPEDKSGDLEDGSWLKPRK